VIIVISVVISDVHVVVVTVLTMISGILPITAVVVVAFVVIVAGMSFVTDFAIESSVHIVNEITFGAESIDISAFTSIVVAVGQEGCFGRDPADSGDVLGLMGIVTGGTGTSIAESLITVKCGTFIAVGDGTPSPAVVRSAYVFILYEIIDAVDSSAAQMIIAFFIAVPAAALIVAIGGAILIVILLCHLVGVCNLLIRAINVTIAVTIAMTIALVLAVVLALTVALTVTLIIATFIFIRDADQLIEHLLLFDFGSF
jgi:hypothetical protein